VYWSNPLLIHLTYLLTYFTTGLLAEGALLPLYPAVQGQYCKSCSSWFTLSAVICSTAGVGNKT